MGPLLMLTAAITVLVTGIAVGVAAFTITRTKITGPLREWVASKSAWFGNLIACPYCLSHWFALVPVAVYQPTVTKAWGADLIVAWLVTIAVAIAAAGAIGRSIKGTV